MAPPATENKVCLYKGRKFISCEDVASIINETCRVLTCIKYLDEPLCDSVL